MSEDLREDEPGHETTHMHTLLLQKPLMQYFQEIYHLRMEDPLPSYIPTSILIQHYVYFRIALRRYAAWVAKPYINPVDPSILTYSLNIHIWSEPERAPH